MATDTQDKWKELRKPFPTESIGKLPRGGVQLDFVGHANIIDHLLSVDSAWFWEPLAFNEQGLPRYDEKGGLWIKLTVLGVTRLGCGDGPDPKQRIGDALRNAAMRFGVALDPWSKDELESTLGDKTMTKPEASKSAAEPASQTITKDQAALLMTAAKNSGASTKDEANQLLNEASGLDDWSQLDASRFTEVHDSLVAASRLEDPFDLPSVD